MTASRHLIGKDSLIISLAVSINLNGEEDDETRKRKEREGLEAIHLAQRQH